MLRPREPGGSQAELDGQWTILWGGSRGLSAKERGGGRRETEAFEGQGLPSTGAEAPSRETGETRLEESRGQGGLCLEQARSHELRCQKELWKISGLGFRPLPPSALPLWAV